MSPTPSAVERARFEANVQKSDGCWVWMGRLTRRGYGSVLSARPKRRAMAAHRISWELYRGPIPEGMLVLHRCDYPPCVNPDHLFLGTVADNNRDMVEKGRSTRGERHPKARLKACDVLEIRRLSESGATNQAVATMFGVSDSTIDAIRNRRRWNHV